MLGAGVYAAWLLVLTVTAGVVWGVPAAAAVLAGGPLVGMAGLLIRERWRGAWSDARRFFLLRSRRDFIATLRADQRSLAERLKTLYQERAATAAA
jgi:hypothetical protein